MTEPTRRDFLDAHAAAGRSRTMASLATIADYWATAEETRAVLPNLRSWRIGWGEPFCFGCGWLAPVMDGPKAWSQVGLRGWLERAHLVDHWLGGSGAASNLVPLCHLCHMDMRQAFNDRAEALAWVDARQPPFGKNQMWWQLYTDGMGEHTDGNERSKRSTTLRWRGDFLALLVEHEQEEARLRATQVAEWRARTAPGGTELN